MTNTPQPLIQWHTRFNTGHAQIDAQHRELVGLINRFAAEVETGGGECPYIFSSFREALGKHFIFEETALRRLGISAELLREHSFHHSESLQLLDVLGAELQAAPREHSLRVLTEVAHCLLVDLLDEDRYMFVADATRSTKAGTPPAAPVLSVFGRLVDQLNDQHERIAEARDYYLTLLNDFPAPVCRTDAHGRFDWFNRTWLSLTGQSHAEATAYGWINAIHGEDRPLFLNAWQDGFATRVPFVADYRITDANGELCWMQHIAHPFYAGDGEFLGYICTLFDITERRRNEASLRVSAEVFEHALEAIMITDARGCVAAINPAFTRITGYGAAEAVGRPASLLRSGFHADDFYQSMWRSVLEVGHWKGEVMNRRKDGELFPAWLSISVVKNSDGEILRMVGILHDVTPLRADRDRLHHLAHHDALTGLPNRLLFGARAEHGMERCAREGRRLAVLFLDLDNFKPVNDALGHKVGDATLQRVATALKGALREEDTVARLGGDEFVVLVERVEQAEDARHVTQKLLDIFPLHVGDGERRMAVTASIGFSLYPDDGTHVDMLIEQADKAMYRAKQTARS